MLCEITGLKLDIVEKSGDSILVFLELVKEKKYPVVCE